MLPRKRIALIHIARQRLGLDEATYRQLLTERGGVTSARDLDDAGFAAVMGYFIACGFRSTWTQRTFGTQRAGMASPRQVEMIKALWREVTGGSEFAGLDRWLEKSYGVSSLRFASGAIAGKAITGLKSMKARQEKRLSGAA